MRSPVLIPACRALATVPVPQPGQDDSEKGATRLPPCYSAAFVLPGD